MGHKHSSKEEIRSAFLRLAKLYHPDRITGHDEVAQSQAAYLFSDIRQAYKIINDHRIADVRKFPAEKKVYPHIFGLLTDGTAIDGSKRPAEISLPMQSSSKR